MRHDLERAGALRVPRPDAGASESWQHASHLSDDAQRSGSMNYEFQSARGFAAADAPIVADASPDARAAFITKTYLHLLGAIVVFAALEMLWFVTPVANGMFAMLGKSRFAWLLFMAAFVGVSYVADRWALSSQSRSRQYMGLGLYTLFESLMFVPLIGLALMYGAQGDTSILPRATLITLTMFGALTGIVFVTRKDFSFLRGVLMLAGLSALGLGVLSIVFGFTLGMFFSYAMIALACGYILYSTSNVMLHYRTNQHVAASLALFAAVMLLFWYVLRILIDRRR
jgi:FtsH-binding integral membrane protein